MVFVNIVGVVGGSGKLVEKARGVTKDRKATQQRGVNTYFVHFADASKSK
jgi:hypothetical protein